MYEESPSPDQLRQGDVLDGFYFPRISLPQLEFLHELNQDGSFDFAGRSVLDAKESKAVVISQCCEFNEEKRKWFSVASLSRLSNWTTKPEVNVFGVNVAELVPVRRSHYRGREGVTEELVDFLREANRIDPSADTNHAVNVFLYEADGEALEEHHLVNFSQVVSVRIDDHDALTRLKVLQLDREHRHMMQNKLGYFYARKAEEVAEDS